MREIERCIGGLSEGKATGEGGEVKKCDLVVREECEGEEISNSIILSG